MNAKFSSKDIRQLGLSHLHQQVFETDSDDEDFDDNSAANQESEDRDYQGGADGDDMSETSEEMKELVRERATTRRSTLRFGWGKRMME